VWLSCSLVGTRGDVLLLVRRQPGSTVSQLADQLGVSGVAVRRQLAVLSQLGLVESVAPSDDSDECRRGRGRPPGGWRVTTAALEDAPGNYDAFALDLLADLSERDGSDAVDALLARQSERLTEHYRCCLEDVQGLAEKVARLAELRDDAGYAAFAGSSDADELLLTECNCAVYQVAERYPTMCELELEVMRDVLGPDVDVQRVSHTMRGDGVCAYRITSLAASMPAAPA
jgi:predicted ArsR family transcriptional regulator